MNFIDLLTTEGCRHERSLHIDRKYAAAKLPFNFTERHEFPIAWKTNLNHLIGFFSSLSMYPVYCQKYPDNSLLEGVRKDYLAAKGHDQTNPSLEYDFTGFAILGKSDGQ